MLLRIKQLISDPDLIKIQQILQQAKFRDGKLSAGLRAQQVKNNQEISKEDVHLDELNSLVMNNLVRHPIFQRGALPHRVAVPFYVRYEKGMHYGEHIDDPIMGPSERYRSDLAVTVFLNEPHDYQGGELIINTSYSEQSIKYAAGDVVMYPANTLHRVATVTEGVRLVAVTWVQSMVRSNEQRELLYQLSQTRDRLMRKQPDSEECKTIDHVYVNLVRMWSEV